MYRTILLPTDGSDGITAALDHAIDLARTYDAALRTVYVVDVSALPPDAGAGGMLSVLEDAGTRATDEVVAAAEDAGIEDVQAAVRTGRPAGEIVEYAEEVEADLVVMGTHGRSGLDRFLLGSVAERVVRTAPVPVMTVAYEGEE